MTPKELDVIKARCEAAKKYWRHVPPSDVINCLDEIERLKTALRDLYNDCRNEPCDEQRGKVMDRARKVLEAE